LITVAVLNVHSIDTHARRRRRRRRRERLDFLITFHCRMRILRLQPNHFVRFARVFDLNKQIAFSLSDTLSLGLFLLAHPETISQSCKSIATELPGDYDLINQKQTSRGPQPK
jgi:hypothetical protein